MRKAAIALALAVSLGGCANLQNAWQTFSSAQVTPSGRTHHRKRSSTLER